MFHSLCKVHDLHFLFDKSWKNHSLTQQIAMFLRFLNVQMINGTSGIMALFNNKINNKKYLSKTQLKKRQRFYMCFKNQTKSIAIIKFLLNKMLLYTLMSIG